MIRRDFHQIRSVRHDAPRRTGDVVVALTIVLVGTGALRAEDRRSTTVGMAARIDQVVLPGPELEVRPLSDRSPLVLRIAEVYPHGTAFRYSFVYYGLEPGTFDLRDYLRRKDGSSTADLPPLRVEIQSVLPPGQIEPNPLAMRPSPVLGGYRLLLVGVGILWVAGLLAILLVGRRKKRDAGAAARPLTVADRLRPLVEKALAGKLTPSQLAELERALLAFWRRRLRLENARPAEAMTLLRAHQEAGPLLAQLEAWLHRPGTAAHVDVAALLRPYQNIPPEAIDLAEVEPARQP
ncbi:MAG TPA: hypothetical protein VNK04_09245 [Gemmataceae bacterium]|nr:hypothetical protein [Gemmataceae bacterium]